MVYESPCHPCEYNHYSVDEFGDCIDDVCTCPENEKCEKCWLEQWAKEEQTKRDKERRRRNK